MIDLKSCSNEHYVIDSDGGGCVCSHTCSYTCMGVYVSMCTHRGLRSTMVSFFRMTNLGSFLNQISNNLFPMIVLLFENFIPVYNVFGPIHLPIPPPAYPPSNFMSSSFLFL